MNPPGQEPLAHSTRRGAPEQSYREYVSEVCRLAMLFGSEATEFSPKWRDRFLAALEMASHYHDLGKLDELFQEDLRRNARKTRINHVDAGVAHLLAGKHAEAAVAAYSHHIGLPSFPDEKAKNANGLVGMFRDLSGDVGELGIKTSQRTDSKLTEYLPEHHRWIPSKAVQSKPGLTGLVRRLLLSCLVDGDHSDTARHYQSERSVQPPKLRAIERLAALDRDVGELASKASLRTKREMLRHQLRQEFYQSCRERPVSAAENVIACDSPVGTGKTTAVMAHLLKAAAELPLRRIFVVLPFTNIIDQSVDVYRRALRLEDETEADLEGVVAAHHHRAEFADIELRQLASRWDSPIVVTTAVQFFGTLASHHPASLRKFHQITGAGIFVDEAHAAMPAALWPQMLRWLRELCDEWSSHLILASGSLTRFWTLPEFVPTSEQKPIPELVPDSVRQRASQFEESRINILKRPEKLSLPQIADFIQSKPGPQLVILNTVQSADVLANYLRDERKLGLSVEHLSTALTPLDRAKIINRSKSDCDTACGVSGSVRGMFTLRNLFAQSHRR